MSINDLGARRALGSISSPRWQAEAEKVRVCGGRYEVEVEAEVFRDSGREPWIR